MPVPDKTKPCFQLLLQQSQNSYGRCLSICLVHSSVSLPPMSLCPSGCRTPPCSSSSCKTLSDGRHKTDYVQCTVSTCNWTTWTTLNYILKIILIKKLYFESENNEVAYRLVYSENKKKQNTTTTTTTRKQATTKNKQFLILLPTSRKFDRFQNFPTCCAVVQLPMLSSHWEKWVCIWCSEREYWHWIVVIPWWYFFTQTLYFCFKTTTSLHSLVSSPWCWQCMVLEDFQQTL